MSKRSLLVWTYTALACAIVTSMSGGNVRAESERSSHIFGTWIVTVSPDLPPGAPPLTFTELITFDMGGGLTETNTVLNAQSASSPILPPPATGLTGSGGHGTWRATRGGHNFAYTFRKLLYAGPDIDPIWGPVLFTGQHVGAFTVQALFSLRRESDDKVLEGRFTGQFRNIQDVVVSSASGTFVGQHVAVEPLTTPE